MLLPLLILACLVYIAFAIVHLVREKQRNVSEEDTILVPVMKFVCGGGVPIAVAATMAYLFLIVGGATTVQFNVGSSSRMNVWSTWVELWPIFLFLTAAVGLGTLIWTIVSAVRKSKRSSLPASIFSFLLSVLSFFTVVSYFPSA